MDVQDSFFNKVFLKDKNLGKTSPKWGNIISLCWPTNISYVQIIAEKYIVLSLKKIGQIRVQIDIKYSSN